jgi:ArsR family transcriptional regulator
MHTISLSGHEVFRALSDPTRLRIALLLLDRELCVCDLTAVLELPQSSISRHMGALRAAGLVADRRDGRWVHYRLSEAPIVEYLRPCLAELSGESSHQADRARLREHLKHGKCRP